MGQVLRLCDFMPTLKNILIIGIKSQNEFYVKDIGYEYVLLLLHVYYILGGFCFGKNIVF